MIDKEDSQRGSWETFFFCNFEPFNSFSANPTKWSNTLKQYVGKLLTNCLSVFDHFVGLAIKNIPGYGFSLTHFFLYTYRIEDSLMQSLWIVQKKLDVMVFSCFLKVWAYMQNFIEKKIWNTESTKLFINPLSANPTTWWNTLKKFVGNSRCFECFWPFYGAGASRVKFYFLFIFGDLKVMISYYSGTLLN